MYAPHCYPYDTHEGNGYTESSKKQLVDWERERKKEVIKHGEIPLLTGEFGLSPTQEGFTDYLTDFNAMSDRNLWHWTYWSNDLGGWSPFNGDGTETAIAQYLLRSYPKATAGKIVSFSFDVVSKKFEMKYMSNKEINLPTEIFIPKRYYPNGYNLAVNGATNYTQSYDEIKQVLKITVSENATVTIEITAK